MQETLEPKQLSAVYHSKEDLRRAYMPFVSGGGMFIPDKKPFHLGERIHLQVQLMDEKEIFMLKAKVVWITPIGAQAGLKAGIGVQLEDASHFVNKVETYLAGAHTNERVTDTL